MSPAPETVLCRVRQIIGTSGVERLNPAGVRLLLAELLFDSQPVPDWHTQAACQGMDRETFFPEPGDVAQVNAAKQVCTGCPVRAACLADVMAWERPGHRYGVVGGLSAHERQQLHRANPEAPNGRAAA